PKDHPNRARQINTAGNILKERFSKMRARADLEEAIRVIRQAIKGTPEDYSYRAQFLSSLRNYL
ncbi:uncharacterized protein BCR38DRAFT_300251, partial [Pseudomassariella vexata]